MSDTVAKQTAYTLLAAQALTVAKTTTYTAFLPKAVLVGRQMAYSAMFLATPNRRRPLILF